MLTVIDDYDGDAGADGTYNANFCLPARTPDDISWGDVWRGNVFCDIMV